MPNWVTILLQVVEAVIQYFMSHPPGPNTPQVEKDQQAKELDKAQRIAAILREK